MAQSNAAFALVTLGQWCRNHGIYEVRDVLAKAAHLAAKAESSELLAGALDEAAIAADVPACPAPVKQVHPEVSATKEEAEPTQTGKGKLRRARGSTGHFKADDPATPENEAWEAAD